MRFLPPFPYARRGAWRAPWLLLAVPIAAAGCDPRADARPVRADAARAPIAVEPLASPAPEGSAEPNVTTGPDGFYLSWLERTGEGRHALRFARLGADGWTEPATVMERTGLFVNWADFPSILALEGGVIAAHWLEKSGPGPYAYDVRMAISTDAGTSWSEDIIPHSDGVQAEHGFVSLFPEEGGVGVVWLDGRETVREQPMTLRFTTVGPGGAEPDALLDGSVCDCCQTDVALADAGPVVVYRDRTEDEVRDIYTVRRVGGEWTSPAPVHRDGWVIAACPVNGPAVAAEGDRVVAAWYTGAPEQARAGGGDAPPSAGSSGNSAAGRVLAAFSEDGGASFGEPQRLDEGGATGRVDVVMLPDGSALVTWLERTPDGAEIRMRQVAPGGNGPILRLAETSAERASGFPRMSRRGDQVLFAWTEAGEPSRVRTALGRLTGRGMQARR